MMSKLWGQAHGGRWFRFGVAGILLVIASVWLSTTSVGAQFWAVLRQPGGEQVDVLLQNTVLWIPLVIVGLMVLHTFIPVPAEIIALAAGRILGPFWGFVTVWVGAMLGAYLGFWLARVFGQALLRYLIAPRYLVQVQYGLQRLDLPLLFALRLLPVFSFNLVNYTLGLSSMSWWRFTWTTAIGIVPAIAFIVVFGAHLHDWRVVLLMVLLALFIGLAGYWLWHRRTTPFSTTPGDSVGQGDSPTPQQRHVLEC
jgi:uncharacterized membrane protein YdjX (TVP38/TMEM64 family)